MLKTVKELCEIYGSSGILIMIGMKQISDNELVIVPCRINEEKYRVSDGNMITLKPRYQGFATQDFSLSTLDALINGGAADVYVHEFAILEHNLRLAQNDLTEILRKISVDLNLR